MQSEGWLGENTGKCLLMMQTKGRSSLPKQSGMRRQIEGTDAPCEKDSCLSILEGQRRVPDAEERKSLAGEGTALERRDPVSPRPEGREEERIKEEGREAE